MKKKILISLMLLLLPAFFIINSLADEEQDDEVIVEVNNDIMINSPLFTKKEQQVTYTQPAVDMTMAGFEFVVKKGDLSLYTNPDNGSIRVQNDVDGYVWASDIINIDDYKLNKARKNQLQRAFDLSYRDASNAPKTVNSTSSDVDLTLIKTSNGLTYQVTVEADSSDIKFEFNVVLSENGFDVTIPHEKIVLHYFEKYPFLAMLKNAVIKTNALCCMMTGSGPTLFAVYADASIRDRAAEELQAAFPEVGIIVAEQLK